MGEKKREVLPQELVVKFDYAVSMKGLDVEKITFRKPKMKDMQNMNKVTGDDLDREMWLMSCLSENPLSDFENLDLDQYSLAQDVMGKYVK